jgi:farnesyl-diphosphate farnesyltransferase
MQYILMIPKAELGLRRFCFLAFGLAAMTLSKISRHKTFDGQEEVKLSRKAVMSFYAFTKIAVKSDGLMKIFFYIASSSLRGTHQGH